MQISSNYNNQKQNFGMAFRPPKITEQKAFTEMLLNNADGYSTELVHKGLRQFYKEQSKVTKFDTKFNLEDNSVVVIDNLSGKIMDKFINYGTQTGFDVFSEKHYAGRRVFARVLNPKRFIPKNLYLAGERAKELQAKANK